MAPPGSRRRALMMAMYVGGPQGRMSVSRSPFTRRWADAPPAMTDDAEIFRAATALIEQHGEGAILVATRHAQSALQGGDPPAARQWQRIAQAVERLQSAA